MSGFRKDGITVSVITPARDAAASIERAVLSVQAQSRTDWEMIVVDDGSCDGTSGIAVRLAEADPRLQVHRHDLGGRGVAAARNTALSLARGRYIAFLDADDEWASDKLERQLMHMAQTNAALSYTGFCRVFPGKKERRIHVPSTVTRAALLRGNVIGCLTAIYDRAALGDCPMPDLPLRQDFALWLSILDRVPLAYGLDEPLALLHMSSESISANKFRANLATWQMYRKHLGFGRLRAGWYLGQHVIARLQRG